MLRREDISIDHLFSGYYFHEYRIVILYRPRGGTTPKCFERVERWGHKGPLHRDGSVHDLNQLALRRLWKTLAFELGAHGNQDHDNEDAVK